MAKAARQFTSYYPIATIPNISYNYTNNTTISTATTTLPVVVEVSNNQMLYNNLPFEEYIDSTPPSSGNHYKFICGEGEILYDAPLGYGIDSISYQFGNTSTYLTENEYSYNNGRLKIRLSREHWSEVAGGVYCFGELSETDVCFTITFKPLINWTSSKVH
jgi:hypothetical protein